MKKLKIFKIKNIAKTLFICFFLLNHNKANAQASTINIQGTGSTNTITNNSATIVDNGITISANGTISGFVVTITDSYQSGDVLAYNTSTGGALPTGITVQTFNTTTRSLVFQGSATASVWQNILRNVTLTELYLMVIV